MSGKCPKCDKQISHVNLKNVNVNVDFQPGWLGVTYCCPFCDYILGVGIDPVALKTDTIDGVIEALKGR